MGLGQILGVSGDVPLKLRVKVLFTLYITENKIVIELIFVFQGENFNYSKIVKGNFIYITHKKSIL